MKEPVVHIIIPMNIHRSGAVCSAESSEFTNLGIGKYSSVLSPVLNESNSFVLILSA